MPASAAQQSADSIEYGDCYPLLSGRSPEDVLTPETTQLGFVLVPPNLAEETRTLSRMAPTLREKRSRLKEKVSEGTEKGICTAMCAAEGCGGQI